MAVNPALKAYAAQLGFGDSENLAAIFDLLFQNEEEVRVVAALPGTVSELAQKTGLAEGRVTELIEALLSRGAISHPMKRPEYLRRWPVFIELRDASVLNPSAPQKLFELWERLITTEVPAYIPLLKKLKITPLTRVVPIERSVSARNTVLDADSARKIFQDADLISVLPCACRTQAKRVGRGQDCPAPEDSVCMQANGFAKAVLDRGIGREITREDALRRVGEAEEAGLVHMVRNNIKTDMFMCNCCSCCCTGLYLVNQLGYHQGIAPSRFRAEVDEEACEGCGTCEDRCQFNAITIEETAVIDHDLCFGCGNCAISCPEEALSLVEVRPIDHIRVK